MGVMLAESLVDLLVTENKKVNYTVRRIIS
jgi:hypothetical protein